MTYPDSVRFLYSLGNEARTAELGLARMTALVKALDNPHRSTRFVHVAGTNGKGSVAAMIEAGARASGLLTGLYTSPHLQEPTERIRLRGEPVAKEQFLSAFTRVHETAEALIREGVIESHPTYFETITAMAFLLFEEFRVELAVLEVGLGGRLDATNVVTPALSVITPVDFDHEKYLGRGLDAIAAEKAGILKQGVPAVFAGQRPEVGVTLEERAVEIGIEPIWVARCWHARQIAAGRLSSSFVAEGPARIFIECPLPGEHQVDNALTSVAALHRLGFPAEGIRNGIRQSRWPGRLERVSGKPEIFLDGAHNPAGARALAAYINRFYSDRRVWLVFGAMRDKAVEEMSGILFPLAGEVIATAPAQFRAVRPESFRHLAFHPRLRTAGNVPEALTMLKQAAPEDVIFITGSLFLVGEARSLLVK